MRLYKVVFVATLYGIFNHKRYRGYTLTEANSFLEAKRKAVGELDLGSTPEGFSGLDLDDPLFEIEVVDVQAI